MFKARILKLKARILCLWVFPEPCTLLLFSCCPEMQRSDVSRHCPTVSNSSSWSHLVSVLTCQCLPSLRSLGSGGCAGLHCPLMVHCGTGDSQFDKNCTWTRDAKNSVSVMSVAECLNLKLVKLPKERWTVGEQLVLNKISSWFRT